VNQKSKNNISQDLALESKSWPFVEAARLLNVVKNNMPEKGYVAFETGYGPSGLPHIGTFGEVARTSMVIRAFKIIAPEIPVKLICFSDDMDGLRKIPDNIPDPHLLEGELGKPLTSIADPFGKFASYGEFMNNKLKEFLDQFSFEYDFYSATECYKSGMFNKSLSLLSENYNEITKLVASTLGQERAESYSPFMPICKKNGKVLESGVTQINGDVVEYIDSEGNPQKTSILDGNCKLQWKADFGMRWHALDIDYEMYGKDIIPSAELARKICRILGGKSPVNFHYELFLDEEGHKISKSKGNGLTIDEWLRYAPSESISYYMYLKPKTAKRLHFDVIPKATDEYLQHLSKFNELEDEKKLASPIYHIHGENPPEINLGSISFSLLLNLASACNPDNEDILWGFISEYDDSLSKDNSPYLGVLVRCAINYYDDFIKPNKNFRAASEEEKKAILELKKRLSVTDSKSAQELQNIVYDIGNEFEFNLRGWFQALYQILLGQDQGPRMGSFIALFGVDKMIGLIDQKIA
jgi:lysyl-tRNA synthetase class 1